MRIGAQFYTIRDFCKNLGDFSESLKKVADIGYEYVQISGTCAYEPEWLAEELKKNGLKCGITHFDYNRIIGDTENTIAAHKTFGCPVIGLGSMPDWGQGYDEFKEKIKVPAQKIHEAGLQFSYHNHNFEYLTKLDDGRPLMYHLSDDFTPDEVCFTLDTYWVKAGGYDVVDEIKRLAGRIPVVHLKDMLINEKGEMLMEWIGGGNCMDFEKICAAFEKAGTREAYVEQDNCNGENPFDCLKKSYDYLTSLGLK